MLLLQFHPESAPGQFEVAIGCFGALEAADKLLLAREAVAGVARKAGFEVTMAPKPIVNHAGNGCHCHVSLWRVRGCAGLQCVATCLS